MREVLYLYKIQFPGEEVEYCYSDREHRAFSVKPGGLSALIEIVEKRRRSDDTTGVEIIMSPRFDIMCRHFGTRPYRCIPLSQEEQDQVWQAICETQK